jgi:HlyD family secretion protein
MKRFLVAFAVLAILLIVALAWKLDQQAAEARRPPGSSGVVEGTRTAVAARVGARILKLHFREGDKVEAGVLMAELDCTDSEALVAEAAARVEAAEAQVRLAEIQAAAAALQARAAKRQAEVQKVQVGSFRVQGANAQRQSDRAGKLRAEHAVAETTWEAADTASRDLAIRAQAAGAAADAASWSAQAVDRQARGAEAQVEAARKLLQAGQAGLKRAKVLLAECRIVAPTKGRVTLRAREPGEVVLPGSTLYEITDLANPKVTFYVSNADRDRVREGMRVRVVPDAGDRPLDGVVERVSREAAFTPRVIQTRTDRDRLVYAVDARLSDPEGSLAAGMPVEVEVVEGP